MEDEKQRFHRMGLPDKFEHIRKRYSPFVIPASAGMVLTINQARNCLVHRGGKVSERDTNTPEGLLVRWLKVEVVVTGPSGTRVVVPPADVEKGEIVSMRMNVETSKLFRLGGRVDFTAQEFSEICWSVFTLGTQFAAALESYGKTKGVKFAEPSPSGADGK